MNDRRAHVLIAGGGVAALEATLALRALAPDLISIELLAPDREFTYRPLSVAEPFRVGEMRHFPLQALADAAGARLREGSLASVDTDAYVVKTTDGDEVDYDRLLLATGARPRPAVPNALTFARPQDERPLAELLERALLGEVRSLVFAVPAGVTWSLPLYELALLTSAYLVDHLTSGVELTIVTPEEQPLALFGTAASDAVGELLELRGIRLVTHTTPVKFEQGALHVVPNDSFAADCVVALPRLEGQKISGIPQDRDGFVPVDEYGRVESEADVYAAGDLTQFPLKQGGIATQQADVAATSIAADLGAAVELMLFRPVLRGLLLTGMTPRYLRGDPRTGSSLADTEPLWWPPAKVVGRYLAPFLASHLGITERLPAGASEAIEIEVELDSAPAWTPLR